MLRPVFTTSADVMISISPARSSGPVSAPAADAARAFRAQKHAVRPEPIRRLSVWASHALPIFPNDVVHMIRENGHLRYLKTVRVTAGVCQGLGRLKPAFTHWYWPGLKRRTNPFGLAPPYVFVKQSDPPCHCDLRVPDCSGGIGTPSSEGTGLTCRIP